LPDAPLLTVADPPEFLSDLAKKHWDGVFQIISDAGILSVHDLMAFTVLCHNVGEWIELTELQKKHGMFAKDNMGIMRTTPFFRMSAKVQDRLLKLFAEFGLTPASRERVKRLNPKKPKDDKWGDF
jgi:P27 family predicted phage terminase small subunit